MQKTCNDIAEQGRKDLQAASLESECFLKCAIFYDFIP